MYGRAPIPASKVLAGEGDSLLLLDECITCLDGPLALLLAHGYQLTAGVGGLRQGFPGTELMARPCRWVPAECHEHRPGLAAGR